MTERNAQNRFKSAAPAALRAPFTRAVRDLAAWGDDIAATFPHADVEFFRDAGSRGKTGRAALKVMFTRAVTGEKAKEHAAYAGFWVTANVSCWHDDVMYEIKPYRGPNDKFGSSHRSSTMPRWFGFALPHTFWSLHDLPLHDEHEGFRSGIEFSKDGRVPSFWRNDLNTLYFYGFDKGIFEDPVEVLASLPPRRGLMPE